MEKYLTIDVGGTAVKYAVMTEELDILEKGEVPTPKELDAFKGVIAGIYKDHSDVKAVCMSAPGKIDSKKGYFFTSGALGYLNDHCLPEEMKEDVPVPFVIENDAKAAALAELWKGSMKGYQSGSVITLGTGIGGSVILDGKLVRGNTFAAGEFSGIACNWNKNYQEAGQWAEVGSTTSIVKNYAAVKNVPVEEMNGRIFFEDANNGVEEAIKVLDEFCDAIVSGIVSLQLILDVQRFSFGGGISKQAILMDTINRKLDEVFEANKGKTPATRPEVVACTFGNDANMIGALYHYLYE